MNRVRLNLAKQAVGLFLESKRPDVSQSLVLDYSIALDPVDHNGASIVNLCEGAEGLVMGWGDNMHFMACPYKTRG